MCEQSNFEVLKEFNKRNEFNESIVAYLYEAEELYVLGKYEQVFTPLRNFLEGFLKLSLSEYYEEESFEKLDIVELHEEFNKKEELNHKINKAIDRIRKMGNKENHYQKKKTKVIKSKAKDILKKDTMLLVNFLLQDIYKQDMRGIYFSEKNLPKLNNNYNIDNNKQIEESQLNIDEQQQITESIEPQINTTEEEIIENIDVLQHTNEKQQITASIEPQINITEEPEILETVNSPQNANAEQQQIIELTTGKHFLQAPPGSGKTTVLSERIKLAIDHYNEQQILCLTFTKKAATELQQQASKVLGTQQPFIGTFNQFCLKIIRASTQEDFSIVNDNQREYFLQDAINQVNIEVENLKVNLNWRDVCIGISNNKISKDFIKLFYKYYSYMQLLNKPKNIDITKIKTFLIQQTPDLLQAAKTVFNCNDKTILADKIWTVFIEFKNKKYAAKYRDHDDVLFLGLDQIVEQGITKDFIQVDEVQDLSYIQWQIIHQLCHENTHLLVAGDQKQLIYGFRNATKKLLRENTQSYNQHTLIQNHRSNQNIVNLLNSYQKHWPQPITQTTNLNSEGDNTFLFEYSDVNDECKKTIMRIKKILKKFNPTIAILLKFKAECQKYYHQLQQAGIKCSYSSDDYDSSKLNNQEESNVIITTVHKAKGSQFNTVFIPQATRKNYWLNENNLPLLYMALSRATTNLFVSYTTESYQNQLGEQKTNTATPFLDKCKNQFNVFEVFTNPAHDSNNF